MSTSGPEAIRFSLVIPVFNEQDNVLPLLAEIAGLAAGRPDETIVVDDGSSDGTPQALSKALQQHSWLRVLRHSRRVGKSAAIRTGVRAARNSWIVTIDGDCQNDPRDIAKLLEAATSDGGADLGLVGGLRQERHDTWSRRAASRIGNAVRNAILRDRCPDTGCGLKLFRRDVFLALPFFSGLHRFLPALVQIGGHRAIYVPISHRPRLSGQSKYGNLTRAFRGTFDLLGVLWLRLRTPPRATVEEIRRS